MCVFDCFRGNQTHRRRNNYDNIFYETVVIRIFSSINPPSLRTLRPY
uniref:Uncharacterized protein n=1 Tax=Anguilla anguilla TaxID=7936 RepID=A0A0E9SK16_ANGAN